MHRCRLHLAWARPGSVCLQYFKDSLDVNWFFLLSAANPFVVVVLLLLLLAGKHFERCVDSPEVAAVRSRRDVRAVDLEGS